MTGMDPIRHWIAIIFMGVVFFFLCVTSAPVVWGDKSITFQQHSCGCGTGVGLFYCLPLFCTLRDRKLFSLILKLRKRNMQTGFHEPNKLL